MTGLRVQTGGWVSEGRLYLERPADRELLEALRNGELCALFAPRQEGKTSLMQRTARTLIEYGMRCSLVDIGLLSPTTASTSDLFEFLTVQIASELGETDDAEKDARGFVQWLTNVAERSSTRIVICIDEVHQLLESPRLAEELLQALRVAHEGGARSSGLAGVSYCIAGVARPRDLVRDRSRDPFDHGTVIRLEDFTLDQLAPLRAELASLGVANGAVDEIYEWTAGHPFMTTTIARKLASRRAGARSIKREVEEVVEEMLADSDASEHYLSEARLLFETSRRFGDANLGSAIEIYRRLLRGQAMRETEAADSAAVLVLAGIAAARDHGGVRMLETRNRIVKRLFGEAWLDRMEVTRQLDRPVQRWLSMEKAATSLLTGSDLASALAIAKRASDVTKEQRELLLASLEADASRNLAEATSKGQAELSAEAMRRNEAEVGRRRVVRMLRIVTMFAVVALVCLATIGYQWRVTGVEFEAAIRNAADHVQHAEQLAKDATVIKQALDLAQTQLKATSKELEEIRPRLTKAEQARDAAQNQLLVAQKNYESMRAEFEKTNRDLFTTKTSADTARTDRDQAIAERTAAVVARDKVIAELAAAVTERDKAIVAQKSALIAQKNALIDLNRALAERDEARNRLKALEDKMSTQLH